MTLRDPRSNLELLRLGAQRIDKQQLLELHLTGAELFVLLGQSALVRSQLGVPQAAQAPRSAMSLVRREMLHMRKGEA